jgi:hypothetical protein
MPYKAETATTGTRIDKEGRSEKISKTKSKYIRYTTIKSNVARH